MSQLLNGYNVKLLMTNGAYQVCLAVRLTCRFGQDFLFGMFYIMSKGRQIPMSKLYTTDGTDGIFFTAFRTGGSLYHGQGSRFMTDRIGLN